MPKQLAKHGSKKARELRLFFTSFITIFQHFHSRVFGGTALSLDTRFPVSYRTYVESYNEDSGNVGEHAFV